MSDASVHILSLDGGGLSCLSQLKMLGEFMHRLQHDTGHTFDLVNISTLSPASEHLVIAILLGVLGLSVDDASSHFLSLCKEIALDEEIDLELRSAKLIAAAKRLLHDFEISDECKLRGELALGKGCKVSIPYLSAADMTRCRMLRSYNSKHSSYNPTLIEAISIAWATPGLFSPVCIGEALTQEQVISAVDGFSNPTLQAVKETYEIFGGNQSVSCLLSLGRGSSSTRSLNIDSQELAWRTARDTENDAELLKSRYSGLQIYFRLSVDSNLESGTSSMSIDDGTWRINAYTSIYLESHDASEALDSGVRASLQPSRVTMDDLFRPRANRAPVSHGLPPLSAFFVKRKKPLEEIAEALRNHTPGSPAVALVIGMSGTGKTQISLKYAYERCHDYRHILFVDASSAESIQKGLITRLRAVDRQLSPADTEEALDLLANPRGNLTPNWLIIMDNADNTNIDIRDFIPSCDHGAILLTSRNTALIDLYPDGHIAMGTMSQEEAVEALLSTVFSSGVHAAPERPPAHRPRSDRDRECAMKLVEELGYLPLAVIQAACYIKKHKCLHEYSHFLSTSRCKILRWPASVQRDKLRYAHSTYAAFDTNINALSPRALQLLGLFSCFHFTDFPRSLIALAASLGFKSQPHELLDQPLYYQQSIEFLNNLFCPDGHWDQTEFDALLEELQTYSLVTIVSAFDMITLRFHPLLHGWANDRLSPSERPLFRAAAARTLVCGTDEDDDHLWPHLSPHVERSMSTDDAHVNDVVALVAILKRDGHAYKARTVLEEVYATVESVHGEKHIRTTRAALQLAEAVGLQGDWDRMESLIRNVVQIRTQSLGSDHLETADALSALARTCRLRERYEESAYLGLEVLTVRRTKQGSKHRDVVKAQSCLAETFMLQENYAGACTLLNEALQAVLRLVGRNHIATVRIMEQLSQCYKHNGNIEIYIKCEKEIMELWQTIRGSMHTKTFEVMSKLATFYLEQGQHKLAETFLRELESRRREMLGKEHEISLEALFCLSKSIIEQERLEEGVLLLEQVVAGRRETLGDQHRSTLEAQEVLARAIYTQGRLYDAEAAFRELAATRRDLGGEHNVDTISALRQLASILDDQGRHKEAESIWRTVLEGLRETLGDQHEDTIAAFGRLADSMNQQDRPEEAGFLRTKMQLANRARRREPQETISSPPDYEQTPSISLADQRAITLALEEDIETISSSLYHEQTPSTSLADQRAITLALEEDIETISSSLYHEQTPSTSLADQRAMTLALEYDMDDYSDSSGNYGRPSSPLAQVGESQENEDILNHLFQAGMSAHGRGLHTEAEGLWKKVVLGREKALGKKHKSTLTGLRWLAVSVYKQQRHADAELLWKDLVTRLRDTTEEHHMDVFSALDWLARSVYKQERYADAGAIWKEAIAGMKYKLGCQHEHTLRAQFWLAICLYGQFRDAESETVLKAVVAGRQLNCVTAHEDTLTALNSPASALQAQGKYSYAEVFAGMQTLLDQNYPSTLKAKRLLVEIQQAKTTSTNKATEPQSNSGAAPGSYEQGRYAESETVLKAVVAGRQLDPRRPHEDTLNALGWQASALHAQGQYSYAEVLRMEVLVGMQKLFGQNHQNTLEAKRLLAETRQARSGASKRVGMGRVVGMFSKFAK